MAKPDMALPSMDTTVPSVIMVKSLVHRPLFMALPLQMFCKP